MANLTFKNLSKKIGNPSNYWIYSDLHFDLRQKQLGISNNKTINAKDIEASYDVEAITNSIFNILNTRKYQRLILPNFGVNLLQYVGRPCDPETGKQLGNEILDAITIWEPRVNIDKVIVVSKPDAHEYDVNLSITIPYLKQTNVKINGLFSSNGILVRT